MGLHQVTSLSFLLFLHISISASLPQSILQILPKVQDSFEVHKYFSDDNGKNIQDNNHYCNSWRLTAETNNAGEWPVWIFPPGRCMGFVLHYYYSERYPSDAKAVADAALRFSKTLNVSDVGKDAWVFDVDDTLLSSAVYFLSQWPFQSNPAGQSFNQSDFRAIPSSLDFYNDLRKLGRIKIFLLTGRNESQRAETIQNLLSVGYGDWERLIMRGPGDEGKTATEYKSEKRKELEDEGYKIRGSSGDQWSDLLGFAVAERSFKLPNPWYYIL